MSTRGFVGFVVDGVEKISYNHFDSYPGGLGLDVLRWLRMVHLGAARRLAGELRVVTDNDEPTAADIEKLAAYANANVGSKSTDDWYVLLLETQGKPAAILDAGAMLDASQFPSDSLFAEWGYVVDFDAQMFEVYEGFQRAAHDKGRFASRPPRQSVTGEYHAVALVATWPLHDLPDDATLIGAVEPAEADA